jgi:hypothetical protein
MQKIKREVKYLKKMLVVLVIGTLILSGFVSATRNAEGGRGDGPVIFVTGQGLYFDSVVTADPLPQKGPFQTLFTNNAGDLWTELGPRDPGYRGGRWALVNVDVDPNTVIKYFECPLLGPGRLAP